MEGNFRIVQEAKDKFAIEKECKQVKYEWKSFLWIFHYVKEVIINEWYTVDKKGNILNLDQKQHDNYRYNTIEEAVKAIEDIKKYPKVVYEEITLSDLNDLQNKKVTGTHFLGPM